MQTELRERRILTWEKLVVKGHSYSDVVSTIATQYDVSESAIESDINRMSNWLPKLQPEISDMGISRLRELRRNRQRYQQMADAAAKQGNPDLELKVRREIDASIKNDVSVSQSLGLTHEEPEKHVQLTGELTEDELDALDAITSTPGSTATDVELR